MSEAVYRDTRNGALCRIIEEADDWVYVEQVDTTPLHQPKPLKRATFSREGFEKNWVVAKPDISDLLKAKLREAVAADPHVPAEDIDSITETLWEVATREGDRLRALRNTEKD